MQRQSDCLAEPGPRERKPAHPPIELSADALMNADVLISNYYARCAGLLTRTAVIEAALRFAVLADIPARPAARKSTPAA